MVPPTTWKEKIIRTCRSFKPAIWVKHRHSTNWWMFQSRFPRKSPAFSALAESRRLTGVSTASTLSVVRRHSGASFAPTNPEITGSYGLRSEGSQVVRERSHYFAMPILKLPALHLRSGRGPYLAATCVRRPRPDNARSVLAWQRSPAQHDLAPLR